MPIMQRQEHREEQGLQVDVQLEGGRRAARRRPAHNRRPERRQSVRCARLSLTYRVFLLLILLVIYSL